MHSHGLGCEKFSFSFDGFNKTNLQQIQNLVPLYEVSFFAGDALSIKIQDLASLGILLSCIVSCPYCWWDNLDKLQKLVCRVVGPKCLASDLNWLIHPYCLKSKYLFLHLQNHYKLPSTNHLQNQYKPPWNLENGNQV